MFPPRARQTSPRPVSGARGRTRARRKSLLEFSLFCVLFRPSFLVDERARTGASPAVRPVLDLLHRSSRWPPVTKGALHARPRPPVTHTHFPDESTPSVQHTHRPRRARHCANSGAPRGRRVCDCKWVGVVSMHTQRVRGNRSKPNVAGAHVAMTGQAHVAAPKRGGRHAYRMIHAVQPLRIALRERRSRGGRARRHNGALRRFSGGHRVY